MDYLELDDTATRAFEELGGDVDLHVSSRCRDSICTTSRTRPRRKIETTYLVRLETLLSTPRDVASALDLPRVPRLKSGTAEEGEASFCRLSQTNVDAFDSWAKKHDPKQSFTKIRISLAHKDAGELLVLGCEGELSG